MLRKKNINTAANSNDAVDFGHNDIPKNRKGLQFLKRVRKDPLNVFVQMAEEHGGSVWYEILGKKVLLLSDATAIEHVFQENFEAYHKGKFNDVLKPMLDGAIFLTEDAQWKKQRREAAPVFANKYFPEMADQMAAAMETMFLRWEDAIDRNEAINFDLEMMWYTLDVVFRALFHERRDDVAAEVRTSLGVLLRDAEERIWAMASIPQRITMKFSKQKSAMKCLDDLVADLVSSRRENQAYPEDLLSRFIHAYTDNQTDSHILRGQVLSFLLAGHETTANALTWAWYELARRPEICARLTQEVDDVLGDRSVLMKDIEQLKYTGYVFEETMRLYAPVWAMSRHALQDDYIPTDDGTKIFVPKDASVMLCGYTTHRRECYWPHPEAFDPMRHTSDLKEKRPKYAHFAFGGGPRLCLGHRFATIESVIALSMIAQRYELTLIPGQHIEPQPMITLRPNKPIMFRIKRRGVVVQKQAAPERDHVQDSRPAATCPFNVHGQKIAASG